ncbi:ATP-binding cassette domain-containing protein [Clostridium aminobutyricum]|uniref:ABC transporter ATP-binding protein n=1 Tax=Clostridium aminobutyricum TaxID=33953 RepID=A0A939II39_CLOAM|nr:ABC transporter ATP-binding protein [Clostridium aminobutyricum]
MRQTAVKIENLSVYYGQTPAIIDASFDVEEGEFLGIIGPNGGGKTTLLKAILGLTPISSGTIEIYGKKISKNRKLIGYVPQIAAMDKRFPISVLEVVLTGRLNQGLSPFFKFQSKDKESAYEALKKVGIEHLANRQISELSGGEFQRMLIARALTVNPKMLILDEPTASVDAASKEQIYNLLGELNKEMTIILVTHDLMTVTSQVNKLVCLNEKLVYDGKPELTEKIVTSLYGCSVDLLVPDASHKALDFHKEVKQFDCCNN